MSNRRHRDRRFRNGQRLGLAFAHLSNGSLGERNPGTEKLGLFCALPLDVLAGRRGRRVAGGGEG